MYGLLVHVFCTLVIIWYQIFKAVYKFYEEFLLQADDFLLIALIFRASIIFEYFLKNNKFVIARNN